MPYARHTIIVNADRLADLHALRAAAGLSKISDDSMLQICLTAGMTAEAESLLLLAPDAALATVPAEYRGPEWDRAEQMLADMRARGLL